VRVDGFYDEDTCGLKQHKDGAILVGGGIGITPMMSMAMGLLRGTKSTKVNLFWVVRTIDEFRIFSKELVQHLRRYGVEEDRFNVKVWITLSQPEPASVSKGDDDKEALHASIDPSTMAELEPLVRLGRVMNVFQSSPCRKEVHQNKNANRPSDSGQYTPDGLSNSPKLSIFIKVFAMIMLLNSFALTSWIVNSHA
jgi:ferredoxin-NADP reductase